MRFRSKKGHQRWKRTSLTSRKICRLTGPTELSIVAFQSYIRSGIVPNIRRSDTFLLSQSVQQSLSFRNLLRFSTGTILLILTKHDTLFISYESLLKNLTLAIRHNLCIHACLELYVRYIRHIRACLSSPWKKPVNPFIYLLHFRLFGKLVDNVSAGLCVCIFCAYVWSRLNWNTRAFMWCDTYVSVVYIDICIFCTCLEPWKHCFISKTAAKLTWSSSINVLYICFWVYALGAIVISENKIKANRELLPQ